jgi:hypothetical protein
MELIRDGAAIVALIATIPFIATTYPNDPVYGIKILLWGQIIASAISWIATIYVTAPLTNRSKLSFIIDLVPYLTQTLALMIPMYLLSVVITNVVLLLIMQATIGIVLYISINHLMRSKIQQDAFDYFLYRFKKKQ